MRFFVLALGGTVAVSACAASPVPPGVRPSAIDSADVPSPTSPTNADAWWNVVGNGGTTGDGVADVQALSARLRKLPAEQVLQAHRAFESEMIRSYSWKLWGAAYVINGGCSDDGFDYFRAWLLMQGQAVFEAALRDPDTLAKLSNIPSPAELEEALSVTYDAYVALTGKEPPSQRADMPDLGQDWDFDDPSEMQRRYPKLSARFARR